MFRPLLLVGILGVLVIDVTDQSAFARETSPHYRVARRIAGPDGRWDLAVVDAKAQMLYVGKEGGILAVNLSDAKINPHLFVSPVVHQILPYQEGRLIATTGISNTAVILNAADGRLLAEVPTGKDPDAIAYDDLTGQAITFNRGGPDTTIFDVVSGKVTGGFKLPGKPESAVADGKGKVYFNIENQNEIGVIDMKSGTIARRMALKGCEEPTGIALDSANAILLVACTNGIAKVLTPEGHDLADLAVGPEPDAAFIDSGRKLGFVPSGGNGTLAIISLVNHNRIRVVQRVTTQLGSRTGAEDPQTGNVYLPAARLLPPVPPVPYPSVVPGSFEILVVEQSIKRSSSQRSQ